MNPVKVLVVEDDPLHIEKAKFHLSKLGYDIVGTVDHGESIDELMSNLEPDIVLLDIQLKGRVTGIDVAKIIQKKYTASIIFLTSLKESFVINEAIKMDPDAILHKPMDEQSIQNAIELAMHKKKKVEPLYALEQNSEENLTSLFVKVGNSLKKILLSDIVYIDVSYKNYCDVHTPSKSYSLKTSLKEIEQRFAGASFLRVHRTAMINLKHIEEIDEKKLLIKTKVGDLPLGASYKKNLMLNITRL